MKWLKCSQGEGISRDGRGVGVECDGDGIGGVGRTVCLAVYIHLSVCLTFLL